MVDLLQPDDSEPVPETLRFQQKPVQCPQCGHSPLADIYYGEIALDKKLIAEIEAGRVRLGGCIVDPENNPAWTCSKCEWQGWEK